jgi:hypothetical protein
LEEGRMMNGGNKPWTGVLVFRPQGFHVCVYEALPYDELLRHRGTLEYHSPEKVSIDLCRKN